MSFEDNREFWEEFIGIYRENSYIWDVKSKDYKNKQIRNVAYECSLLKCKELFPTATKEFVIKKISSMRSSFRRQIRRMNEAKKSGTGADDIPECTLWYFDLLNFLLDQDEVRVAVSSLDEDDDGSETLVTDDQTTQDSVSEAPPETPQAPLSYKRKQKSNISLSKKKEQFLEAGLRVLQQPDPIVQKPESQEMSFGKNVGQQLEGIENRQKLIAQKLISDVLFYAKMNYLQDTSTINISTISYAPRYTPQTLYPTQYSFPPKQQQHSSQYIPSPQLLQQPQQHILSPHEATCTNPPQLPSTSAQQRKSDFTELGEFVTFNQQSDM